ncbi:MAG: LysR family transcriptional regulator [Bosea sp.]|uniref:LysR family transcriptional regulator n=1 Tax=Bosea sp. (in: a-proteobacteria) TaxID=1871050 RepID=UPI001AD359A9|nr:LysR family transcriptional regulator [Bosea sp. (in: a-proteobacteria)]MBN9451675.1 LysR family transcriptional regulator [Bosea sp. (in: a-proteobacteria)]
MTAHFDLAALGMLVAVAETGGFTAAGIRLGRTQSAISVRIQDLENQLGHKLLERSRRGVTPTDAGERLIAHARRLLAVEREALADLAGETPTGRLRIGVPDDYMDAYLRPLIARFAVEHPKVELEVHCDLSKRIEPALKAGDLDLAVVSQEPSRPMGEVLRREPMIWVAARGHRPELQETLPLALFSEGCRARSRILGALNSAGRAYRLVFSCSHTSGVLSAVEGGFCVTAITESAVPPSLRRLGAAEGLPPLFELTVGLIMAPRPGLAAQRFADALREEMSAFRQAA